MEDRPPGENGENANRLVTPDGSDTQYGAIPSISGAGQVKEDLTGASATRTHEVSSATEVASWLQGIGYPEYAGIFLENEVNGEILRTLSSEELRDDLGVTRLRHRRDILDAVAQLVKDSDSAERDALPEHGRILNHLSNVRTYHSWVRVGVQLLAFSIAALRLLPFRSTQWTTSFSFIIAMFGTSGLLWGAFRYRAVNSMIETSGISKHSQTYQPDLVGVYVCLGVMLVLAAMTLTMIFVDGPS